MEKLAARTSTKRARPAKVGERKEVNGRRDELIARASSWSRARENMRHWLRRRGACFLFIFCKVRSRSALFVKRVLERRLKKGGRHRVVRRGGGFAPHNGARLTLKTLLPNRRDCNVSRLTRSSLDEKWSKTQSAHQELRIIRGCSSRMFRAIESNCDPSAEIIDYSFLYINIRHKK
jgi:hypothetical protein